MTFNNVAEIYDFLDQSRRRLEERIEILTDDEANFRPDETSWSAGQIADHLAKTETGLAFVLKKLSNQPDAGEFDGMLNPPVSFEKIAAELQEVKLDAPSAIRPETEITATEALAKLRKSRESIQSLRTAVETRDLTGAVYPHPFLGNLNIYQWLAFIGLHELRHLGQLERLLSQAS